MGTIGVEGSEQHPNAAFVPETGGHDMNESSRDRYVALSLGEAAEIIARARAGLLVDSPILEHLARLVDRALAHQEPRS